MSERSQICKPLTAYLRYYPGIYPERLR